MAQELNATRTLTIVFGQATWDPVRFLLDGEPIFESGFEGDYHMRNKCLGLMKKLCAALDIEVTEVIEMGGRRERTDEEEAAERLRTFNEDDR